MGSPSSTVSASTNSNNRNSSAIGIKFLPVEFVISKFILVEFSLCTAQHVQILHSTIFPGPKKCPLKGFICTKKLQCISLVFV